MFQDTWASHQREVRVLGGTQKANLFKLGLQGALEGLLILFLLIKHLRLVLAIVVTWVEKHGSERGFLTGSGLNQNFRFLRNLSALGVEHPSLLPRWQHHLGVNEMSTDTMY